MPPAAAGERLDRHVADHLDRPRNQVRRWIETGRVRLNGAAAKPSAPLAAGDRIDCAPPPLADDRIRPEDAPLTVLHEDPHLVVLDKPAGLTVHPGAGRPTGTLAHRLLARYPEMAGVGGPGRPGIVHRLDKDTSGLLVVARTPAAYDRLSRAFAGRAIHKVYLAVAYGAPSPPAGRIEAPIARHPERRKEMAVRPTGRPAATAYRTLATAAGISLLELTLETGRTHQIRVHLKHRGHPLVGDPLYGEARWKSLPPAARAALQRFPRPALHAWRLALTHPITGAALQFEAPLPEDLRALWLEASAHPFPALPHPDPSLRSG